jgi:hypothetical protein
MELLIWQWSDIECLRVYGVEYLSMVKKCMYKETSWNNGRHTPGLPITLSCQRFCDYFASAKQP